jgi:hypothetical protein
MRISLVVGSVLAATVLLATGAFAARVTVKQYLHPSKPEYEEIYKIFLDGAKEGMMVSNATLMVQKKQPLFCLPNDLALEMDQTHDILVHWIGKQSIKIDDMSVSVVLLKALQETFPCNR